MTEGPVHTSEAGSLKHYEGHVTFYLIASCFTAATGGLLFGYDLGISGGVTSMDDFLEKFFPKVYRSELSTRSNNYCRFSSQSLQLFTSSLYLAGAVASIIATYVTSWRGRKLTIILGGLSFFSGAVLNGAAENLPMLIIGRAFLGIGVGFVNQAFLLYLSEMALPKWRGTITLMSQSATTIGILAAGLINYGTGKVTPNGWRISLGLAAIPGFILTVGAIFLPDTPNSLVERGHTAKGRHVLEKIRGVKNVDAEFEDLLEASRRSKAVKSPWRTLLQRRHRPQLVIALVLPAFQLLTGISAVTFYAPVIFRIIGFGSNTALYSAAILGSVRIVPMWLSMVVVDRWGRRVLFFEGGLHMAACQIAVGVILEVKLGLHNSLDHHLAVLILVLMAGYVAGFDFTWGALGWLVPTEISPLEIRSAVQGIAVAVDFLFAFIIGQVFLTMFCHLRSGVFYFFAGWLTLMTVFVALFLPETKGIPLEQMVYVWQEHWFWRRYVCSDIHDNANNSTVQEHPL